MSDIKLYFEDGSEPIGEVRGWTSDGSFSASFTVTDDTTMELLGRKKQRDADLARQLADAKQNKADAWDSLKTSLGRSSLGRSSLENVKTYVSNNTADIGKFYDWQKTFETFAPEWVAGSGFTNYSFIPAEPPMVLRRGEKKVKDAIFTTLILTLSGTEHEVIWFEGEPMADVLERMAQSMR